MKRLLTITSGLTFILIVLGGTVRVYGAGLSCPDWPLCFGQWIPPFDLEVLLEWTHRLIASLVGFCTLAIVITAFVQQRQRVAATVALLLVILQAVMGGLTVLMLVKPYIVTAHLAIGLFFLALLLRMWMREKESLYELAMPTATISTMLGLVTLLIYAQAILGALVSSSHAGLACPDFPTCFGVWVPELSGLVALQFFHRVGAFVVTIAMLVTTVYIWFATKDRKLRMMMLGLFLLTIFQLNIGIGNIFMKLPKWMRITHLAIATAMFANAWVAWYKVRHARLSQSHKAAH